MWCLVSSESTRITLPETNSIFAPENRPKPNTKVVFQPYIFRGELLVSGRVTTNKHDLTDDLWYLAWQWSVFGTLEETFEFGIWDQHLLILSFKLPRSLVVRFCLYDYCITILH